MLNRRSWIKSLGFATLVSAFAAWGQMGTSAGLEVPFAFVVSGKAMPAGTYFVSANDPVITIKNIDSNVGFLGHVNRNAKLNYDLKARMTFIKAGNSYYLKSASLPGKSTRWKLDERSIAMQARNDNPSEVVILARR